MFFSYRHLRQILSLGQLLQYLLDCTLFLKGEKSPYIEKDEHFEAFVLQFPHVDIQNIAEAGHWLHAEQNHGRT